MYVKLAGVKKGREGEEIRVRSPRTKRERTVSRRYESHRIT